MALDGHKLEMTLAASGRVVRQSPSTQGPGLLAIGASPPPTMPPACTTDPEIVIVPCALHGNRM